MSMISGKVKTNSMQCMNGTLLRVTYAIISMILEIQYGFELDLIMLILYTL